MAKFTTAIELDIELKKVESIQNATDRLEELKKIAQEAIDTFGEFSPEAQKASEAVNGLTKEVESFQQSVEQTNPSKLEKVQVVTQSAARGFQAMIGASVLFGKQSEALEQTMIKLQAAMALSEGLIGLSQLKNEITTIAGPLMKTAIGAFKAFGTSVKATLISTGIGAFVVALGTIVTFWDDIKEAVSGVSEEQKDLLKNTEDLVEKERSKKELLDNQDQILKQQGKSEEDILKLKVKQQSAIITGLESQLAQQKEIKKQQEETAKRNAEILQNIIRLVAAPLTLLLAGIDAAGKAFGENFGLEESFSGGLAKLVFDPEEVKKEADKSISETEKALNQAKNQLAGYENSITQIQKDANQKRKEDNQKQQDDEFNAWLEQELANYEYRQKIIEDRRKKDEEDAKERADLNSQIENAINDVILSAQQKEIRASTDKYDDLIAAAKKHGMDTKLLEEAKTKALADINDKYRAEDEEKQKAYQESINQFTIDATKNALQTLIDLNDAAQGVSEEARRRTFENNKKLSIAMAIVDTYQSASAAYASQIILGDPTSLIRAQIAAGIAIASGIVRVKKIVETKFEGGNISGDVSGGGSPSALAPQGFTRPKGVEELFTQDRKVYVLESDITMTQERNKRNKSLSIVE